MRTAVTNQVVVPDADGRYLAIFYSFTFYSEFLNSAGNYAVQYWNLVYMRESNPVWTPVSSFTTNWNYDGTGQDFGLHVVTVNGGTALSSAMSRATLTYRAATFLSPSLRNHSRASEELARETKDSRRLTKVLSKVGCAARAQGSG